MFSSLDEVGVPDDVVDHTFNSVIEFSFGSIIPPPTPSGRWSRWESLADVFARGRSNTMWHIGRN